jgi:hypothetical protein
MVTRYADLIEAAIENLATAHARTLHPAHFGRPDPAAAPYLADVADALAHLGTTLGHTGTPTRALHSALRAVARTDLSPTRPPGQPVGPCLDLAETALAVRVAADLIASHGPPTGAITPRQLAGEWDHPRPDHLHDLPARQGAWTQLADVAASLAELARRGPEPLLSDAAGELATAAAAVPRHHPSPAVQATGPAWPLPLPRHRVPDEWAGRLEEVTALAWRLTQPPDRGRAHPIHALRLLAETGYLLHTNAAAGAPEAADRAALHSRAQLWRTIHRQVHTLHTPTEPLMPAQEFALLRTRALAAAPLSPDDLRAGLTTWTQLARWAPTTLAHALDNPLVGLGPTLTPELRAHLTGYPHPGPEATPPHPHEAVLLASLNQRPASHVPAGALDPITALYHAAATPPTPPTSRGPAPAARRLASVPNPAAAALPAHPKTRTTHRGPRR